MSRERRASGGNWHWDGNRGRGFNNGNGDFRNCGWPEFFGALLVVFALELGYFETKFSHFLSGGFGFACGLDFVEFLAAFVERTIVIGLIAQIERHFVPRFRRGDDGQSAIVVEAHALRHKCALAAPGMLSDFEYQRGFDGVNGLVVGEQSIGVGVEILLAFPAADGEGAAGEAEFDMVLRRSGFARRGAGAGGEFSIGLVSGRLWAFVGNAAGLGDHSLHQFNQGPAIIKTQSQVVTPSFKGL
jgi:hypothetical protein